MFRIWRDAYFDKLFKVFGSLGVVEDVVVVAVGNGRVVGRVGSLDTVVNLLAQLLQQLLLLLLGALHHLASVRP